MASVLWKAISFAFIIFLAFGLKKLGLFKPTDYTVMVKIVLNITLPAAVIVSFATTTLDLSMLIVTLLGFLANGAMLLIGLGLSRKKSKALRALYAICTPGYNIGAFAMPFAQGFLGAAGVAGACLFDTGNAIMCTGGSYAATDLLLNGRKEGEKFLLSLLKKLGSSVPFLTYTAMLILSLCRVRIPTALANFLQPIANANAYCAMFMIGLMFDIQLRPETLKAVAAIVIVRNLSAIALSAFCYFMLPLPLPIRQALAIVVFAPPSALSPAFTEKCGGDPAAASCVSSLCILTALLGMTAVLALMNL